MLEILLADRNQPEGLESNRHTRFNLMLEILLADRPAAHSAFSKLAKFQSHA